ncbi:glycosyltransferase family 2 protein [Rhodococcus sp. BP-349]|uniref:glycosyltransferase family 2 protein n=1 Tax=unclassified Rhodococcus (in: high G+C Gram-positive bacteria) TaxID=192944 RepID=UPI001C9A7292|nr:MULTISPECIES: glycosyltransferase family 2 protein [unclassified Rhodococcus (in: high G+C Gram-positive bacteria)]MBY6539822.1 glycosyltransferase family 2 protein [Rhodococcus sp. BP-363]MBY6543850.1 glycosyltransferase family 2 protein [Rhodococcus sp. BP-369]MBY6563080.1 glycosyltransferase family 2 protein [Rhodococcus sp. BP-370]MBY6577372.1 glycosyltransferase family 2 protein [Rhodococcus sp. BP-364]MBY6586673.1 glycosyltransferase family 2 protein [Rhodococcus sp. BP-358]
MVHSLSVVIPAHNEESSIEECLHALLVQSDAIHEIIVVDNASDDDTRRIVDDLAREHDSVRVVSETTPGVIAARNAGFDAASGSLVARIDADTVVQPGWAPAIVDFFTRVGPEFGGGSGFSYFHDLPFQRPFRAAQRRVTEKIRARTNRDNPVRTPEMIGLNMVLTTEAWESVKGDLTSRSDVHEDVDLSICLRETGVQIGLVPGMSVTTSGRRYLTPLRDFLAYYAAGPRTYLAHGSRWGAVGAAVGSSAGIAFYLAMWVPFRAWNPRTGRFELSGMFSAKKRDAPRISFTRQAR